MRYLPEHARARTAFIALERRLSSSPALSLPATRSQRLVAVLEPLLCSMQPNAQDGAIGSSGFRPRQSSYLRISPTAVLQMILYLEPAHVDWMNVRHALLDPLN